MVYEEVNVAAKFIVPREISGVSYSPKYRLQISNDALHQIDVIYDKYIGTQYSQDCGRWRTTICRFTTNLAFEPIALHPHARLINGLLYNMVDPDTHVLYGSIIYKIL